MNKNLMATWWFSKKQKDIMINRAMSEGKLYHPNFINGVEFTEVFTCQDEPQLSNFDDAIMVYERFDLPLDKFMYKHFNRVSAKLY